MQAFRDDRLAWRHAPYGGVGGDEDWILLGENLTGATLKLQVRPAQGDTATPLVNLDNAAAGSEGLSLVWDPAYPDPETLEVVGATIITPFITKATLQAVPVAADTAQDRVLEYDLHIQPSGGIDRVRFYGLFTLDPGVTIV